MSELHLTRVYRAARSLVWQVWTDPAHVAHWWGPRGSGNRHGARCGAQFTRSQLEQCGFADAVAADQTGFFAAKANIQIGQDRSIVRC